jgi:hypothetical protein
MSRAGKRSFDRCDVKVVEFKEFGYREGSSGIASLCKDLPNGGKDNVNAGYWAVLHCPRTEDERIEVTSENETRRNKPNALKEVRTLAGQLVCEHCRFSTMTPVEVSIERTRFANAEAERIEAFGLRQAAIAELVEKGIQLSAGDV